VIHGDSLDGELVGLVADQRVGQALLQLMAHATQLTRKHTDRRGNLDEGRGLSGGKGSLAVAVVCLGRHLHYHHHQVQDQDQELTSSCILISASCSKSCQST
jgi:hypothetical protein